MGRKSAAFITTAVCWVSPADSSDGAYQPDEKSGAHKPRLTYPNSSTNSSTITAWSLYVQQKESTCLTTLLPTVWPYGM